MTTYTVRFEDDTCGEVRSDEAVREGDTVTAKLHDENGNPVTRTGEVVEVLDEEA